MRWRVMMVLATAALAGSLLANDAQARGGGGHRGGGVAHIGGFRGAHIVARRGGFGEARVGRVSRGYRTAILRGSVGNAARTGYGTGIGYGRGIRYGTGIFRDRFSLLAASALAQSAIADDSTAASAPTVSAAQNPPTDAPSLETASGPGLTLVGRDRVSTKPAGMTPVSSVSAPSNTQNQAASAFRSGNLVRLRSGGPLMTVKGIKGDQVECFWTDENGQINADSFPMDVLQMG
jgi:uncharacterized protein YodC (DUF2158 family)